MRIMLKTNTDYISFIQQVARKFGLQTEVSDSQSINIWGDDKVINDFIDALHESRIKFKTFTDFDREIDI